MENIHNYSDDREIIMIKTRLIRLLAHARKYIVYNILWQWAALIAQIVAVFSIASLLESALSGTVGRGRWATAVLILAITAAIRYLCDRMASRASFAASADVKGILRERIYGKLLRLGAAYREQVSTAEVVQLSTEGVEQLETYFGKYLPQLFYSLLAPLTLFIVLSPISLQASLVLLAGVPLMPMAIVAVQKIAKRLLSKYWGAYASLGDSFLENLQGLTTLKIYQADEDRAAMMDKESQHFRRITMKVLTMQLNSTSIMDIFAYGGAAAGMVTAILQFYGGGISMYGAIIVCLLAADFFLPLRRLGSYFHIAMNGMAASDKIFRLLDLPDPAEGIDTLPGDDPVDIRLENTGFSYEEGRAALQDVSLYIPTGSIAALVGESGCGKSTIANLLAGRIRNYSGSVKVGGRELSLLREESLLSHVVLVNSRSHLFKGTVRENLCMGKPDASDQELQAVLQRVNLWAFLKEQNGLDTLVAEDGSNLSGGQRQRLAIARALLADAPVYIFDEATSNIDTESEEMILSVIRELAGTKTVLMISHRLSSVRDADVIYMMEQGKVVEAGTHEELFSRQGPYQKLYSAQRELEEYAGMARQTMQEAAPADMTAAAGAEADLTGIFDEETTTATAFSEKSAMNEAARVKTATAVSSRAEAARENSVGAEAYAAVSSQAEAARENTVGAEAATAVSSRAEAARENSVGAEAATASASAAIAAAQTGSREITSQAQPAENKNRRGALAIMGRLILLIRPLIPIMLAAIVLGTIGYLCAIFLTVAASRNILNGLSGNKGGMLLVLMLLMAIARGLLHYAEQYCNHFIAFKLLAIIRHEVFAKLRTLCPAKLEGRDKGNLISIITTDTELLEVFYAHTISPIAIAVCCSLILTVYIGTKSVTAGIFALAGYLVVGVVIPIWNGRSGGDTGFRFRNMFGELNSFVLDSLRGLDETIQYRQGGRTKKALSTRSAELSAQQRSLSENEGIQRAVTDLVILAWSYGMLLLMLSQMSAGTAEFAKVLLCTVAMMGSFGPTAALSGLSNNLTQTLASGERVLSLLEEEPEVREITAEEGNPAWDGYLTSRFQGTEVRNVSFAYDREQILDNVSVSIKPGTITGIHGPSGSGKSTLLKLLMRFWNIDEGQIEISGEQIGRIPTEKLREAESYVTQETCLFHDSIAANIGIGCIGASREDIIQAAKQASIHDFIQTLPKGYDTEVGELGDTLSGGERQRIGLARAFLHDAPFMLLDEPTSNLDALNEGIILRSLRESAKDKTIVLVSHRASTLNIADAVIEMDSGRAS